MNALKKSTKETETLLQKRVTDLEKEKAIFIEKYQYVETKLKETEDKYLIETEQLKDLLSKAKEFTSHEKKTLIQEIEKLKSINV